MILERAKKLEATIEDEREKVIELQGKLSQRRGGLATMPDFLMNYWGSPGMQRKPDGLQLLHRVNHKVGGARYISKVSPPVSPVMYGMPHVQKVPRNSPHSVFQRSSRGAPSRVSSEILLPRQMLFDGKSS